MNFIEDWLYLSSDKLCVGIRDFDDVFIPQLQKEHSSHLEYKKIYIYILYNTNNTNNMSGRLCKDLFGGSLYMKGKQVLDDKANLRVKSAVVNGDLTVKGEFIPSSKEQTLLVPSVEYPTINVALATLKGKCIASQVDIEVAPGHIENECLLIDGWCAAGSNTYSVSSSSASNSGVRLVGDTRRLAGVTAVNSVGGVTFGCTNAVGNTTITISDFVLPLPLPDGPTPVASLVTEGIVVGDKVMYYNADPALGGGSVPDADNARWMELTVLEVTATTLKVADPGAVIQCTDYDALTFLPNVEVIADASFFAPSATGGFLGTYINAPIVIKGVHFRKNPVHPSIAAIFVATDNQFGFYNSVVSETDYTWSTFDFGGLIGINTYGGIYNTNDFGKDTGPVSLLGGQYSLISFGHTTMYDFTCVAPLVVGVFSADHSEVDMGDQQVVIVGADTGLAFRNEYSGVIVNLICRKVKTCVDLLTNSQLSLVNIDFADSIVGVCAHQNALCSIGGGTIANVAVGIWASGRSGVVMENLSATDVTPNVLVISDYSDAGVRVTDCACVALSESPAARDGAVDQYVITSGPGTDLSKTAVSTIIFNDAAVGTVETPAAFMTRNCAELVANTTWPHP